VTGSLDDRVPGLHNDLCRGKIPPDQNVKVFDLGKGRGHGVLALSGDFESLAQSYARYRGRFKGVSS
jgi:hypothetical protein